METSFLLAKQNRKYWVAMALIFIMNGILLMFGDDMVNLRMIIGGAMILLSMLYLIYSLLGYSVKSKYAAKVKVTDKLIELKTSFWKPLIKLKWQDIKNIHFDSYSIDFELTNGTQTINYYTSAERSIQLKQLLRETAEQRNIKVMGG